MSNAPRTPADPAALTVSDLALTLDPDLTLLETQASPRALPFPGCPAATHLDDLLTQVGHLPWLLEPLSSRGA